MKKLGISRDDHDKHEITKFKLKKGNTYIRSPKRLKDIQNIKNIFKNESIKNILCIGARDDSEVEDFKKYFECMHIIKQSRKDYRGRMKEFDIIFKWQY
jgi:hypothetical protein